LGVIYTGDVKTAPAEYNIGALRIQVRQVFLSRFDTAATLKDIKTKIDSGQSLSDEDMLRLIILPLTQPVAALKQPLIENTINIAKELPDEQQQLNVISGILTAADKFIDPGYKNNIMEWIKMTKVARWFEEEKIEAVNQAVVKAVKDNSFQTARLMLLDGDDYLKVMKCTGLTRDEVSQVQATLSESA
jgi:hypothetical protein